MINAFKISNSSCDDSTYSKRESEVSESSSGAPATNEEEEVMALLESDFEDDEDFISHDTFCSKVESALTALNSHGRVSCIAYSLNLAVKASLRVNLLASGIASIFKRIVSFFPNLTHWSRVLKDLPRGLCLIKLGDTERNSIFLQKNVARKLCISQKQTFTAVFTYSNTKVCFQGSFANTAYCTI